MRSKTSLSKIIAQKLDLDLKIIGNRRTRHERISDRLAHVMRIAARGAEARNLAVDEHRFIGGHVGVLGFAPREQPRRFAIDLAGGAQGVSAFGSRGRISRCRRMETRRKIKSRRLEYACANGSAFTGCRSTSNLTCHTSPGSCPAGSQRMGSHRWLILGCP